MKILVSNWQEYESVHLSLKDYNCCSRNDVIIIVERYFVQWHSTSIMLYNKRCWFLTFCCKTIIDNLRYRYSYRVDTG